VKLGLAPLVAALLFMSGCASAPPHAVDLPPPLEATTLGVGDVFVLRIVGEDKLPTDFTVAPDGSADLPYIKRVNVEGLEPQELAEAVRRKLVEGQILTDPSVSISVKEYNSKRVEVIGEVQKPGSIPLQPGMRLLRVLAVAGGVNALANKNRVTIRRKMKGGATKVVTVSVQEIIDNKIPDPPLQSGDSINVEQRVF
jgi:protein involved in polysaccharide export with SLBB domain